MSIDRRIVVFRETHWAYRRPMSYEIDSEEGDSLGSIEPIDGRTRTTSLMSVVGAPVVVLELDRHANTTIRDPGGAELGRYRRRRGITTLRMQASFGGETKGMVEQRRRDAEARILRSDGSQVAVIERLAAARFGGASISTLSITDGGGSFPPALLLAAVPALDALRKANRRYRS